MERPSLRLQRLQRPQCEWHAHMATVRGLRAPCCGAFAACITRACRARGALPISFLGAAGPELGLKLLRAGLRIVIGIGVVVRGQIHIIVRADAVKISCVCHFTSRALRSCPGLRLSRWGLDL